MHFVNPAYTTALLAMASMAMSNQIFMGQLCHPQTFTFPNLFGAQFTNVDAVLMTNYSIDVPSGLYWSHEAFQVSNIDFCKVSLVYTHPGYGDEINVQVWLPAEHWNGRLQGSGGGGFQTGLVEFAMAGAVNDGYSVVSTDGGHALNNFDPSSWALSSPGNVNWALLQDFASLAIADAAVIGKAVTTEFYGRAPAHSYWNGCSTGGRQGLMLAQRFPDAYDGILAAAPAVHWSKFLVAEFWPQMTMYEANQYPNSCELNAITAAAIEACDELDGVKDNVISSPHLCHFDANTMVGQKVDCDGFGTVEVSEIAAKVANVAWTGARKADGSFLWHGLNHEAPFTGILGLANTMCEGPNCKPDPFPITAVWLQFFLLRDPHFDVTTLGIKDVEKLFHQSHQQFRSIISTDDPDLSEFRDLGGKMITWHGLADQVIFPNGSSQYYESVAALDSSVQDYYRLFEAPGVWHCYGGPGPYPGRVFETLVDWVENGNAPDVLLATSPPDEEGRVYQRNLCAYPKRSKFRGTGDPQKAENYKCV